MVEIARIGDMKQKHGRRFLQRCFTPGEIALAQGRKRELQHLAGRFAAKEAILKALGTGWSRGIAWRDMDIVRLPSGAPSLRLTGVAAEIAREMNIDRWLISLSHTDTHAVATAIAIGPAGFPRSPNQ